MWNLKKLKIDWKIVIFAAVVLLAIFFRIWNFSDWLFFKMDQARDALLIKQALENGLGWLPLLGPKAGGTELNLGPAFYYFQYASALLFNSAHPAVLAYPDLLFGMLSIPLFYFFLKKYFSRDWSMILAGLYAVCFLGIQYSRFAWNPNALAFFNLLFFHSLLNVFDERIRYRFRWIVLAGFSFSVSSQLHFLSFFTLPVIAAVFVFFNRKEAKKYLSWKYVIVFFAIAAVVYLPVFANEISSGGENTAEFVKALKEKPSEHNLWQNINRNIRYWGQSWFLMLTSWISQKGGLKGAILAWLGAILPAFVLAISFLRKEKGAFKKRFILVVLLWFSVYFLAYIPIAYQIRPRFFLPLIQLPFVMIGFLAVHVWKKKNSYLRICVAAALSVVFFGNILGTVFWFREIRQAQAGPVRPWRTIVLKAKDGIVFWHLEEAVKHIEMDCPYSKIYLDTSPEYKTPMNYVLSLGEKEPLPLKNYSGEAKGCFYSVGIARSKKIDVKNTSEFEILNRKELGALAVYKLNPKKDGKFMPSEKTDEISKRIFWKDFFQK